MSNFKIGDYVRKTGGIHDTIGLEGFVCGGEMFPEDEYGEAGTLLDVLCTEKHKVPHLAGMPVLIKSADEFFVHAKPRVRRMAQAA